jgi:hypothetical protein
MFISILILILLLPFTFLSLALDTFFSSDELDEMGISLGNSEAFPSQSVTVDLPKPYCTENTCQLWNVTEHVMG